MALTIYSNGIVHCSVCTDLTDKDEIEAEVNRQNPTGVTPWKIKSETFADGTANPSPCEQEKGKTHYLLTC